MTTAFFTGYLTAFALIMAIGAQNAFVLRHGLMRAHVFAICLFAASSDAILIIAGMAGFARIVDLFPLFPILMMAGGALFLLAYGAMRFIAAYRGNYEMQLSGQTAAFWPTMAAFAAMTWLNPHVYLDTMGLIGAASLRFETLPLKIIYGTGAILASFSFFFSFGYGARLLAPLVQSPRAWRILDILIGALMWALAVGLILELN